MDLVENIIWFLTDTATIALLSATVLGFFLIWGVAVILTRTVDFGARGVFVNEIKGFYSWSVGFLIHAIGTAGLGVAYCLVFPRHYILLMPYVFVFMIDIVLFALHRNRAAILAAESR